MKKIPEPVIVIIVSAIIIGIMLFAFHYLAKVPKRTCETYGQIVQGDKIKVVLDGRIGMVNRVGCQGYYVRFSSDTLNQPHHLLGSGGEIKKGFYSTEFMRPFEIEAVK